MAELLEERRLLTLNLSPEPAISSYAGVGFALNPVALINGTKNGVPDNNPADYQVQIDWGDSSGNDSSAKLVAVGNQVLVKGTHVYQNPQNPNYQITVHVSGPNGQTANSVTCSASVSLLPDVASRTPQPAVPASQSGPQPLGNETLNFSPEPSIDVYAGVGFALNPVALINGSYNNNPDNTPGDYQVQVNWGDSPQWDSNTKLVAVGNQVLVKGTHIYKAQGTYDVVVYGTGPDGQTFNAQTVTVFVSPLPDVASRTPQPAVPASQNGPQPLGNETLNFSPEPSIDVYAGVGFALNPVALINGSYNNNPDNTPGDYQVQVNWGDSPQWDSNTKLVAVGNQVLVKGTHIYKAQGTYDVVVYGTGPDGQTFNAQTVTVFVSPLPDVASRTPQPAVPASYAGAKPLGNETLNFSPEPSIDAYAGIPFSLSAVALINGTYNNNPDNHTGDYHAQINWGDSPQWDANTTLSSTAGNTVLVSGAHVFALQGNYDVVVYGTGPDGQTFNAGTTTVFVSPLLISANSQNITATEGTAFNDKVASFSVNDPKTDASDFSATIDWGDGTTTTGDIAANTSGGYDVSGNHTYADELTSVPVTVTITAVNSPDTTGTANSTADVQEADNLNGNPTTIATTEGQAFQGTVASFADPGYPANNPSDFSATIDWGDGTTAKGTVGGGNGSFTVTGAHTYADEGTRAFTVTLSDDKPGTNSATASGTANIADAPLTASGTTVSATEGVTFTGVVATFTDAYAAEPDGATDFAATIDWGGGTTTTGTVSGANGSYTVTGTHSFPDERASVPISVAVKDDGGQTATANSSAMVADASLAATGTTVAATPGMPFTGTVATFTDVYASEPDGPTDFTATIDWGDGMTTSGTIAAQGAGKYSIAGTHTYFDGCGATIAVKVLDDGGASATANSSATFPGITPLPSPPPPTNQPAPAPVASTWQPVGPAPILNGQTPGNLPVSGRITGIATSPADPKTIYIAAAGGGVWKTVDGGATWVPLTDHLTDANGNPVQLFMGAIALAPTNANVIYAGTGEANGSGDSYYGRGVLVSTDGGAHWTLQTNGGAFNRQTISKIVVDPTDPRTVYVAVAGAGTNGLNSTTGGVPGTGVWKSTDGGAHWTNTTATAISMGATGDAFTDVVIDPFTPQTLYVAVGAADGSTLNGIWKTTNGGGAWTQLTNGVPAGANDGRITLAIAPSAPQTLYAAIAQTTAAGSGLNAFLRTTNGGTTWTTLVNTPNFLGSQGNYDTALAVDPMNPNTVFAAGQGGAGSVVAGVITPGVNNQAAWADVSGSAGATGPHADHHALVFNSACQLLDANDGGIFMLNDPSTLTPVWSDLNGNLQITEFNGIALDPTNANVAYGGSQDNGTEIDTGTLGWNRTAGGDGGLVQVDPTNGSIVYHTFIFPSAAGTDANPDPNFFVRSTDGGHTWSPLVNGINTSDPANSYVPFVIDPTNAQHLLLGTNRIYTFNNVSGTWSALTAPNSNGWTSSARINGIAIAPSDARTIYATTADGNIFVSHDAGAHWAAGLNAVAHDTFAGVAVDPTNAQVAYAVRSAFDSPTNTNHVFETTDGGRTWIDIDGIQPGLSLPNVPAWSIVVDSRTNPARLFVGTDTGVYASTDGGSTWAQYMTGLPNVRVASLALNTTTNILAAGTYGRGMWEIQVPAIIVAPSPPNAPALDAASVTGTSPTITSDNGSAAKPLVLDVSGVSPAGGYVRLFDVTDPANPVLLGAATANNGNAVITLSGQGAGLPLPDGSRRFAATVAVGSSGPQSALSSVTSITIQTSLTITGSNPANGAVVGALPGGQIVLTFSHLLAGLSSGGSALTSADPYGIFLLARGPSGSFKAPGVSATAPGYYTGNLPLHANATYQDNGNGTSSIVLTPTIPLSTDVYLVSVTLNDFTDLAGNTLSDPAGGGYRSFLLQLPPANSQPLAVTRVTTYNGFTTVNNNLIAQPDTLAIRFNKPLYPGAAAGTNVELLANPGPGASIVGSMAAYSPTTNTIYLTPTAPLNPGTVYLIQVSTAVSDDQGFGGPGFPLGKTFYDSFTVSGAPAGAGQGPFQVATDAGGNPRTLPIANVAWSLPFGYESVQLTERLNITSLDRYSAMLVPESSPPNPAPLAPNIPLNSSLAFNPNTNQLIIVPTAPTGNNVLYVTALARMKAANGDPLLNGGGQAAGVGSNPPYFATFLLQTAGPAVRAVVAEKSASGAVVSSAASPLVASERIIGKPVQGEVKPAFALTRPRRAISVPDGPRALFGPRRVVPG